MKIYYPIEDQVRDIMKHLASLCDGTMQDEKKIFEDAAAKCTEDMSEEFTERMCVLLEEYVEWKEHPDYIQLVPVWKTTGEYIFDKK